MFKNFLFILLLGSAELLYGQSCPLSSLGQNPSTAFPVCGNTVFTQTSVPLCGGTLVQVPGCPGGYPDTNPYWYKFTCYVSGSLGFLIQPNNPGDDYDWQLWDVTNRNVNQVYNNPSWVVAANWAGTSGNTGTSSTGFNGIKCGSVPSDNVTTFAQMPNLIAGHDYLLLISHFTNTQSGYHLSFGGGTAVITDPLLPKMDTAKTNCDPYKIRVELNKKMKCSSLTANGSEFSINAPGVNVIGASGIGCSSAFDFQEVELTLDNPLPPGNYLLTIQHGPDVNTVLDICDREIPVGDQIPVFKEFFPPTPMDSITPVGCSPQSLELIFSNPIRCNSIAVNGSDFQITGPSAVTITGAQFNCSASGFTNRIQINLAQPIQTGGLYNLLLQAGSDGNTLIDSCNLATPPGSTLPFETSDTVNADFTYSVAYGCDQNTVQYQHAGGNGVTNWNWSFNGEQQSNLQNPVVSFTDFNDKLIQLTVSNERCSDTSSQNIHFDNFLKADFEVTQIICPDDPAVFINHSQGDIVEWFWNFDNGQTSILRDPPDQFYSAHPTTDYNAMPELIIRNGFGCYDTIQKPVKVVHSCFIAVPSAFTPNGDGLNDFLYPLNAYQSSNLSFSVFNRFGERIFHTTDWTRKWDGTYKGRGCDPGTYVWMLSYTSLITQQRVEQKGTTILIRQ